MNASCQAAPRTVQALLPQVVDSFQAQGFSCRHRLALPSQLSGGCVQLLCARQSGRACLSNIHLQNAPGRRSCCLKANLSVTLCLDYLLDGGPARRRPPSPSPCRACFACPAKRPASFAPSSSSAPWTWPFAAAALSYATTFAWWFTPFAKPWCACPAPPPRSRTAPDSSACPSTPAIARRPARVGPDGVGPDGVGPGKRRKKQAFTRFYFMPSTPALSNANAPFFQFGRPKSRSGPLAFFVCGIRAGRRYCKTLMQTGSRGRSRPREH